MCVCERERETYFSSCVDKFFQFSHVISAEKSNETVVGFWGVLHVGWYQIIGRIKYLQREREREGGREGGRERERGREGGREREREGRREGERERERGKAREHKS